MKHFSSVAVAAMIAAATAPTIAHAALSTTGVCPSTLGNPAFGGGSTGSATDCNLLITFNADGSIVTEFGPETNYDGVEDALIGVVNHTGSTITSFNISNPGVGIFGFDADGIDGYLSTPISPNASDTSDGGYGGPDGFFTGINATFDAGTVNFLNGIAPGGTDYFSLEESISLTAPPVVTSTPEPASIALLGAGLAGLGLLRRRKAA